MIKSISNSDMSQKLNHRFSEELIEGDKEIKMEYFKNYVVEHKFLENAIIDTIGSLTNHVSESLVFVCGPSGVGKKELIRGVTKRLNSMAEKKIIENPGCIPVVQVEALAPQQGSFNFNNLYKSILKTMNEVLLNSKISYSDITSVDSLGQSITLSKVQKAEYHEVLQNALRYRDVMALIINEAHHMLRISGSKKFNWSIDLLKSLTNESQTPIVLVGTYALASYLVDFESVITDQINQRARIINFPRYRQDVVEEVDVFLKTAKKLLLNMPLEKTSEHLIDKDWRYFYKYSLGCIGTLKNWLMRAYSVALDSQSKTLKKEHLDQTKITGLRSSGMLNSIIEGERTMESILSEGDISIKLGFGKTKEKTENSTDTQTNKTTKPFERKSKRDAVR